MAGYNFLSGALEKQKKEQKETAAWWSVIIWIISGGPNLIRAVTRACGDWPHLTTF